MMLGLGSGPYILGILREAISENGPTSESDTTCSSSKLNKPWGVPSDSRSPEPLKGDVLGGSFGFYGWGAETSIDDGGMGDDRIYG